MKRVTNACIGGRNFILNDDAYNRLETFLRHYREKLTAPEAEKAEVMEDLESRLSELFFREVGDSTQVVTLALVDKVVSMVGMPDGSPEKDGSATSAFPEDKAPKKLYRDMDNKGVAGVCAGLSLYFNVDVTILRIIMLVVLFAGGSGFWIYLVLWIAVPKAETPQQKCEMHGIPATPENLARFSQTNA